ncbi:TIGR02679 domain-containing protein [Lactimicrobium massiliense]|jgi:uncharacterized protein (TIGR02679 family)|uniref:TIGR02679 domain-containing protein n=1 Tax=Lactimicrobium massiliense TaxID=2161814 RepID=UPI0014355FF2|nr:TIGR02679 domain-containing protein [Lactimicrobium massiliense]
MNNDAVNYFRSHHGFDRAMAQMKEKWQSYGQSSGRVILKKPSEEERYDLGGFFGQTFLSEKEIRFSLSQFESALQKTKYVPLSLYDLLCGYYQEDLITNRTRKQQKKEQQQAVYEDTLRKVSFCQDAYQWLEAMPMAAFRTVSNPQVYVSCARALALLQQQKNDIRLSVLAMNALGDPHSLDAENETGKTFLHLLQHCLHDETEKLNGETKLDLYIRMGIRPDAISSFTTMQGFHLMTVDGCHPAYEGFLRKQEYYLVSLSQLQGITSVIPVHKPIFLLENQMVFSEIACRLPQASMICTSGQMKTASLLVIDMLAKEKAEMYYSSDLDPEGVLMTERLLQRHPDVIHAWHMDASDYEKSISEIEISERRLHELDGIKSPSLKQACQYIRTKKRAGYQERLIDDMIDDMQRMMK